MDALKEILSVNIPASVAVVGLVLYFFGMAIVFITSPIKNAESFSVKPVDNAGKTEIRVYYGGISFALGAFLLYLTIALKTPVYSLVFCNNRPRDENSFPLRRQRLEMSLYQACNSCRISFCRCSLDMFHSFKNNVLTDYDPVQTVSARGFRFLYNILYILKKYRLLYMHLL